MTETFANYIFHYSVLTSLSVSLCNYSDLYIYFFLLADLFIHSYVADIIADLIRNKEHRLAKFFYASFRYIDDVLSLNNPSFEDLIHRIYSQRN